MAGHHNQFRAKNLMYLEQLRSQVAHRFSIAKHRKRRSDIIVEDSIPDLSTLFMMLGGMAPEQRPLRPVRQERKKVTLQDLSGQEVKVLLSIVRAYDVPVRHDVDSLTTVGNTIVPPTNIPKEANVNSFIVAKLQNSSARTQSSVGPNPSWNQQLELKFKPLNNDFSPDSMRRIKDYLYLHLFDEVHVDLIDDDEERDSQVHHRQDLLTFKKLSFIFTNLVTFL